MNLIHTVLLNLLNPNYSIKSYFSFFASLIIGNRPLLTSSNVIKVPDKSNNCCKIHSTHHSITFKCEHNGLVFHLSLIQFFVVLLQKLMGNTNFFMHQTVVYSLLHSHYYLIERFFKICIKIILKIMVMTTRKTYTAQLFT